jgi:aminoglycoside phosphotransferase (APT) family kinase protein
MTSEFELGRRIGGGHQAELFECGQDACKLYGSHIRMHIAKRMAVREARALKIVDAFDDVPAPRLLGVRQFNDRWGVIMSRIEGQNFASILSEGRESKPYLEEMARLHVAVHRHRAPRLPALKARLGDEIRKAGIKPGATLPIRALLDRLDKMPDSDRLCHGDFHPFNVMGKLGNAWIVDWPHAMRGDPAVDVCQSWLLMQRPPGEQDAMAYVEAYAIESGLRPNNILHWRAIVAGARLADDVPSEEEMLRKIVAEGLSQ